MSKAYTEAGVDIEAGNETVRRIKDPIKATHNEAVLTGIGSFGSLYDIKKVLAPYAEPVLVQSIDGVGTKLMIAEMASDFSGVGHDIVNHCCNDILAMGARPLTFLDYVAHEKLVPEVMETIVIGMAEACRESGMALIGGETAEMPGVYAPGQHDIAGCITGVVERSKIITGERVEPGDVIIGLASNGLHTNGYSLARKAIFGHGLTVADTPAELEGQTVAAALLAPHTNYTKQVLALLDEGIDVRAVAHITGGGFIDNIPRALPGNYNAVIGRGRWPVPSIFPFIQKLGSVDEEEMYKVFNMGIGLTIVIPADEAKRALGIIEKVGQAKSYEIGRIAAGEGSVIFE